MGPQSLQQRGEGHGGDESGASEQLKLRFAHRRRVQRWVSATPVGTRLCPDALAGLLTDLVGQLYESSVMARTVPDDRLARLVECATQVFIEQGYRRTQMADVAKALGVAKGTLYLYVESKDALFDLVARCADDAHPCEKLPALPIRTPKPAATVKYIRERLANQQVPAALTAALAANRVGDPPADLAG